MPIWVLMRPMNRLVLFLQILFVLMPPMTLTVAASDYEDAIRRLTQAILADAKKQHRQAMAVLDFADLEGAITPLGRLLAEDLTASLAATGQVQLVDRAQIQRMLKGQGLSGSETLDQITIKKLGKLAGLDLAVSGSIAEMEGNLRITAKIIAAATGRLIGAAQVTIPKSALAVMKPEKQEGTPAPQQPERSQEKRQRLEVDTPRDMVLIPAGTFRFGDEGKSETISLPAFWIDLTEVSNDDYLKVRDIDYTADKASHPAVNMNWKDASLYCGAVGKRLPTEQEWEKAARGPDGRSYPWGNSYEPTYVNAEGRNSGTMPVGQFPLGRSPYGIFDMAGNVWEWTSSEEEAAKVYRGGSWASSPMDVRSTSRKLLDANFPLLDLGFRCAKDVPK